MNFLKLDTGQQMVARLIAEQRYAVNRARGIVDARIGAQSADLTDLNGIGGELAFAVITNVMPDLTISPRRGGADCVTSRGYTVDVKTSVHDDAQLIAHRGKSAGDAQVYVLVVGEFPMYRIVGWAWASELLQPQNIADLGYGPTYALQQDKLHRFKSLWEGKYDPAV